MRFRENTLYYMKNTIGRTLTIILAATAIISACNRHAGSDELRLQTLSDSGLYICYANSSFGADTFCVKRSYTMAWPKNAPDELKREIIRLAFGDSTANFNRASDNFLEDLMLFDDDTLTRSIRVDAFNADADWMSYMHVSSECTNDSGLYCFHIAYENYMRYAAHGMYGSHYVTYDTDNKRIVRLCDLVDTSKLEPVIQKAIEGLPVNGDVLCNVYGPDIPMTDNFFIDSTRKCIMLVYQPYDIASYANGIQTVVLPIDWLSKQIELTPYAKEIFGI